MSGSPKETQLFVFIFFQFKCTLLVYYKHWHGQRHCVEYRSVMVVWSLGFLLWLALTGAWHLLRETCPRSPRLSVNLGLVYTGERLRGLLTSTLLWSYEFLRERPARAVVAHVSLLKAQPSDPANCGFCQAVNSMLCLPQQ